jgi:hypothetical protein
MDDSTSENLPELTLQDSIALLIQQVPAPVRNFILYELNNKTEELMLRYKIHVDQGGILENELLLMLLGQEEPTEFVSALEAAGIPSQVVQSITNDINQEIFMKLRAAETAPVVTQNPQVAGSPIQAPSLVTPPNTAQKQAETVKTDWVQVTPAIPAQIGSPIQPKVQLPQTQNRDDLHAILKEYGIDPYREPAE